MPTCSTVFSVAEPFHEEKGREYRQIWAQWVVRTLQYRDICPSSLPAARLEWTSPTSWSDRQLIRSRTYLESNLSRLSRLATDSTGSLLITKIRPNPIPMLCSLSYRLSWHIHYLNPSLIHRHSRLDKQGHMGERSGSGFAPVWAPLQTVQTRHPQATRPSAISLDRLTSCTVTRWHVACSNVNHVFLLTRYHARTSENIDQRTLSFLLIWSSL